MNFSPELTGIGKYSGEMVDWLAANGHEVTVVCAAPYYPHWKVQAPYSARRYQIEKPKPNVVIHRCPIWVPKRLSGLKRLLHLLSFALSSTPVLLRLCFWQPAIIFVVAPALSSAVGAWLCARLTGAKAWLHIQDFEVDAAFELGLLQGRKRRLVVLKVERWLMERFDRVSTISQRMLDILSTKKVAAKRINFFPNWVDLQLIHPLPGASPLRQKLGIEDDQIICLYSGTLNRKQGLPMLIDVARILQENNKIVLFICGNGEMRGPLEVSATGLENVRFLDLQPAEGLNDLLNMADIHLLPQLSDAADLVMPSKLCGMLASGRPVLAAAKPGTEIATVIAGRGRVLEPENPSAFAEAILELANNAALRLELGAAARSLAEETLDLNVVIGSFNQALHALVDPSCINVPAGQAMRL